MSVPVLSSTRHVILWSWNSVLSLSEKIFTALFCSCILKKCTLHVLSKSWRSVNRGHFRLEFNWRSPNFFFFTTSAGGPPTVVRDSNQYHPSSITVQSNGLRWCCWVWKWLKGKRRRRCLPSSLSSLFCCLLWPKELQHQSTTHSSRWRKEISVD